VKEMMNSTKDVQFLQSEIDQKILILKNKVKIQKRRTTLARILSIGLGALVTLSLGLEVAPEYSVYQKNIALAIGATLTFVTGCDSAFNFKGLWIRQKSTLLSLYQLKNELSYLESQKDEFTLDDIFDKYQKIWEQDSSEWLKVVREKVKNNTK
jgi:hypothetical protein